MCCKSKIFQYIQTDFCQITLTEWFFRTAERRLLRPEMQSYCFIISIISHFFMYDTLNFNLFKYHEIPLLFLEDVHILYDSVLGLRFRLCGLRDRAERLLTRCLCRLFATFEAREETREGAFSCRGENDISQLKL